MNLTSLLEGRPLFHRADIKKAFPTDDRAILFPLLDALGVPPKLVDIFRRLHSDCTATGDSSLYTLAAGVREGCPSSTTLFIAHHNVPPKQIEDDADGILIRTSKTEALRAPVKQATGNRSYHWHRLQGRMDDLDLRDEV